MSPPLIKSVTLEELEEVCGAMGQPPYRAGQVMEWIYTRRVKDFAAMTNLPHQLRTRLHHDFDFRPPEIVRVTGSADTTRKFLFRLRDGQMIETVLIPASPALYGEASDRLTLCVSSQVGCAYGCRFCASGLDGWKRNLEAGEMVDQILQVERAAEVRVGNLVFMGMGEPMANFENLMRAVSILNAPWGPGIGARRITVSTSGLAPKIRELARHPLQIRLAISLHGATDEVRERIMPVNRRYPLAELLDACDEYRAAKKQKLTFEFILIEGVNDSMEQAAGLGAIAARLNAKVNLIPYNTVEGLDWRRPPEAVQEAFLALVERAGVTATLRREKGHDISAACGQLRLRTEREKAFAGGELVP